MNYHIHFKIKMLMKFHQWFYQNLKESILKIIIIIYIIIIYKCKLINLKKLLILKIFFRF